MTLSTTAAAAIPVLIQEFGPYQLEITIAQDGQTLCDTRIDVTDQDGRAVEVGCHIPADNLAPTEVSGDFSGRYRRVLQPVGLKP